MSQDYFLFFLHFHKNNGTNCFKEWKLLEKLELYFKQIWNVPSVKLKSYTKSSICIPRHYYLRKLWKLMQCHLEEPANALYYEHP